MGSRHEAERGAAMEEMCAKLGAQLWGVVAREQLSSGLEPLAAQWVPGRGAGARAAALVLSRGSVVDFKGDCVVNAANNGGIGGAGVDGAVTLAGGPALAAARAALPTLDAAGTVRILTGDAVATAGGALAAPWCIHAVGPNMNLASESGETGVRLLRSAYAASLRRSKELGAKSVAFALLSSGIFRGAMSLPAVLRVAVDAVEAAAGECPDLEVVHLVAFTAEEAAALVDAARAAWRERGAPPPAVLTKARETAAAASARPPNRARKRKNPPRSVPRGRAPSSSTDGSSPSMLSSPSIMSSPVPAVPATSPVTSPVATWPLAAGDPHPLTRPTDRFDAPDPDSSSPDERGPA